MKLFKSLLICFVCAGCLLIRAGIVTAENITSPDEVVEEDGESSNEVIETNDVQVVGEGIKAVNEALEVRSEVDGTTIHLTLHNVSSIKVKNIAVLWDSNNSYTPAIKTYYVGTLGAGESVNYDLEMASIGNSTLNGICIDAGGYTYLYRLIPAFLIPVGIFSAIIVLRKHFGRKKGNIRLGIIGGAVVLACVGLTYMWQYARVGSAWYSLLDSGENYTHNFEEDVNGETVKFDVSYNQDIITFEVTEKDVEVIYDTTYEYDENAECTAEPVVKVAGQNGSKHVVTTTMYRNGKRDAESSEETVTVEPVDRVLVQGTKTVIETQNVEAYKEYVADDGMYYGQFQLQTSAEEAKSHIGKKEVTWNWDKEQNKLTSTEEVTVQPGTDIWKAGTKVDVTEILKADTEYVAREDQPVGYNNTITQAVDGSKSTTYQVTISTETGLRLPGTALKFVSSNMVAPVNGKVEVGVLRVEDITTPYEENVQSDPERWSNQEEVVTEGVDKIERVSSIMKLDTETGQVTDEVVREVSREVIQESVTREVIRGSKEPTWVEEKIITAEVEYDTVYVADSSLSGDEQVVEQYGERGSLYTTQIVAVDENGNPVEGYDPQIVEQDALSPPVDEIIHVAPDSALLG